MAQVILNRNFFCGYRIRKSPNGRTPVFVPDQYVRYLPKDAKVVSMDGEQDEVLGKESEFVQTMRRFGDDRKPAASLKDFDDDRKAQDDLFEQLQEAEKEATNRLFTSVSIITADAQELIGRYNLDKEKIEGTGKDGRITKADVERYMEALNGN